MVIFGIGWAFFMGILLMIVMMIYFNDSNKYLRWELEENLADAQIKLENLEIKWTQTVVPNSLDNDLSQIRQKLQAHQQIQQQSRRGLKLLQADVTRRETFAHLRSQLIAKTKISGVDEQERRILIGKGVRTAAEIEESRLRGLGEIGNNAVINLLKWREKLESDFIGSAQTAKILQTQETQFIEETTRERRGIEREIERLLMILRAGSVHLHKQQLQLFSKSEELAKHFLQTKSDAKALGNNLPAMTALLLITFLTPFAGAIISSGNMAHQSSSGTGYGISQPPRFPTTYSKADLVVPDEDITRAEIEALPLSTRELFAENLNSQALDDNYSKFDYREAERKMRLAVRLKGDDPRFLNQLGYALCMQGKYDESLSYLNRSLKIDGENSGTKIFIGINYLQTKKFNAARKILTEVTDKYSSSYEGFYNLGLAHLGLKDYIAAQKAFQQAVKINPDDADSHYELGFCAYKLGDKVETQREYSILLGLDEAVAEQLQKDAHLIVSSNDPPNLAVN
jgi:tetratricopeptide (TPR) repeat protein